MPVHRMPRRARIFCAIPVVLLAEPFEVFVAALSVLSGIGTLTDPDQGQRATAIQRQLGPWVWPWALALIIGGLLTLVGLVRASRDPTALRTRLIERLGCTVLAWASLLWTIVIASFGWRGLPIACLLAAFSAAAGARAYLLSSAQGLVLATRMLPIRLAQQRVRGEMRD